MATIPENLKCRLSGKLFEDPVYLKDCKHTFSRKNLEEMAMLSIPYECPICQIEFSGDSDIKKDKAKAEDVRNYLNKKQMKENERKEENKKKKEFERKKNEEEEKSQKIAERMREIEERKQKEDQGKRSICDRIMDERIQQREIETNSDPIESTSSIVKEQWSTWQKALLGTLGTLVVAGVGLLAYVYLKKDSNKLGSVLNNSTKNQSLFKTNGAQKEEKAAQKTVSLDSVSEQLSPNTKELLSLGK